MTLQQGARSTLTDGWGRTIDYLRIAVTQACNLRCTYCLREEHEAPEGSGSMMTTEEIARLVKLFARMGMRRFRFTGGEPLLRKDIAELVKLAVTSPGVETVRITTNGILLPRLLPALLDAGLDGLNLSLDTLDPAKFTAITRRDEFKKVRKALDELLSLPSFQLKINMLLLRGINSDEIGDFAELTRNHAITIRFMELQPFDDRQIWRTGRFMGADMIREKLFALFPGIEAVTGKATEHYSFRLPDHLGSLAIIPAYSRNFCSHCSRLRLTSDGRLLGCLYRQESVPLLPLLRSDDSTDDLQALILKAIANKPKDGREGFTSEGDRGVTSMSQIGG